MCPRTGSQAKILFSPNLAFLKEAIRICRERPASVCATIALMKSVPFVVDQGARPSVFPLPSLPG